MKLDLFQSRYYRVKRGQTLRSIAETFFVPPRVLAEFNDLKEEPWEGCVLQIPPERRNLYTVRGGESKEMLCGSKENFEERNKTKHLYIGQTVWL